MVTRAAEGTSTSIARRRVELRCQLPEGHSEPHYDPDHDERWDAKGEKATMLLRHEDEDHEAKPHG